MIDLRLRVLKNKNKNKIYLFSFKRMDITHSVVHLIIRKYT